MSSDILPQIQQPLFSFSLSHLSQHSLIWIPNTESLLLPSHLTCLQTCLDFRLCKDSAGSLLKVSPNLKRFDKTVEVFKEPPDDCLNQTDAAHSRVCIQVCRPVENHLIFWQLVCLYPLVVCWTV